MTAPAAPFASPAYARYVLAVLFLVSAVNFIDRQILSILLQPIKAEFQLSDTQLGLLSGPAFAIFYTAVGIPIARWADVGVRRSIIALALVVWSGMTALCGAAGSFLQLALFRIGVGVGEAGATPPSHSLIADYFPPQQRGRALSTYAMGIHVGILLGLTGGGYISEHYGWRQAFYLVGLPGVLLGLVVRLTIREPPRGQFDGDAPRPVAASARESLAFLGAIASFRLAVAAGATTAFAGYAFTTWLPTFYIRVHGAGAAELGFTMGLATALGGALGTYAGGALADRLSPRDPRWAPWLSVLSLVATVPVAVALLFVPGQGISILLCVPFLFLSALYAAPTYLVIHGLAPPAMRAMGVAIFMLVTNFIGLGAGPMLVGALNDALAARLGDTAVRQGLLLISAFFLAGAGLFLWCAARLRGDLARLGGLRPGGAA